MYKLCPKPKYRPRSRANNQHSNHDRRRPLDSDNMPGATLPLSWIDHWLCGIYFPCVDVYQVHTLSYGRLVTEITIELCSTCTHRRCFTTSYQSPHAAFWPVTLSFAVRTLQPRWSRVLGLPPKSIGRQPTGSWSASPIESLMSLSLPVSMLCIEPKITKNGV